MAWLAALMGGGGGAAATGATATGAGAGVAGAGSVLAPAAGATGGSYLAGLGQAAGGGVLPSGLGLSSSGSIVPAVGAAGVPASSGLLSSLSSGVGNLGQGFMGGFGGQGGFSPDRYGFNANNVGQLLGQRLRSGIGGGGGMDFPGLMSTALGRGGPSLEGFGLSPDMMSLRLSRQAPAARPPVSSKERGV